MRVGEKRGMVKLTIVDEETLLNLKRMLKTIRSLGRFQLTAFCVLCTMSFHAQNSSRLALVIGNADYKVGKLNNPLNDAILMAETLRSLEFEVMLDTNISSHRAFMNTVREFGQRRNDYDVGLVYYAGHGVQVDGENYLLPTDEEFRSEDDVRDFAIAVGDVMRYLTSKTEDVNVLVLDACRDNPFEQNWVQTRSIKGSGLARISASKGSLIAFSTDAGQTAEDGEGENSLYCESLVRNMQIEDITLYQVFNNVRQEVLEATSGHQIPVEFTKLTGEAFYLKRKDYDAELRNIISLVASKDYLLALEKISAIVESDPKNTNAHLAKAEIYAHLDDNKRSLDALDEIIALDQHNPDVLCFRGYKHAKLGNLSAALEDFNRAIKIGPYNPAYYHERGRLHYFLLNDSVLGKADFVRAISLAPTSNKYHYHRNSIYEKPESYFFRSTVHEEFGEYEKALEFYEAQIAQNGASSQIHYERSGLYFVMGRVDEAITELGIVLEINPNDYNALYFRSLLYSHVANFQGALRDANQILQINNRNPSGYYLLYTLYKASNEHIKSLYFMSEAITKSIEHDDYFIPSLNDDRIELSDLYIERAELFKLMNESDLMCKDLEKACGAGYCTPFHQKCH